MELAQRRIVARVVRFGLVILAVMLAASWVMDRRSPDTTIRVRSEAVVADAPAPGDLELLNVDSTVSVVLRGEELLAGLSPQLVARIRGELAEAEVDDSSGFGAFIAQTVKQTVSDRIGTRVSFSIHDIRDMRYEDGRIVVEWRSGEEKPFLGNVKVDGDQDSNRFREDEALRFIEAVRARQARTR